MAHTTPRGRGGRESVMAHTTPAHLSRDRYVKYTKNRPNPGKTTAVKIDKFQRKMRTFAIDRETQYKEPKTFEEGDDLSRRTPVKECR